MDQPDLMTPLEPTCDAELVSACLAGNRQAFGRIVERYQRLLCSLAYSSTGSIAESEDVAQETFLVAWRQLGALREPEKLRSWLCGILRHQVSRSRRRDGREPVRQAEGLDEAGHLLATDEPIADFTMHREELTLLWRTLERLPERYREPLILYYRENRSIEHVADALELTEDAVKQRLLRGRRMIQEQVLALVEGALSRTTPAKAFTLAVLAALPAAMPTSVKAAGIGTAVTQGGLLAKSTGLATLVASLSGVVNLVFSMRAGLDQTRTPRERRRVLRVVAISFLGFWGFLGGLYALREAALQWPELRGWMAGVVQVAIGVVAVAWPVKMLQLLRELRDVRTEERASHPESFRDPVDQLGSAAGEYRSRFHLLGVPLVHLRFALAERGSPPVVAWIAGGDRAYGLLVAWGTWAVAPISIGAMGIGLFSVGAVSVGVISLGTVAFGFLAMGCTAVGVNTYAWLSAVGWDTAQSGGFAIAGKAALGPLAWAEHANSPLAQQLLADPHAERNHMIFLIVIVVLSVVPLVAYAEAVRRRLGPGRVRSTTPPPAPRGE